MSVAATTHRRRPQLSAGAQMRLAAYGAFLVVGAVTAYWKIYAQFSTYDDEGYVLLSIKQFLRGHPLYTRVYSQYGPFPYELWGALYSLVGRSITPDNARLVVIAVWLLTSLLIGLIVDRVTGSLVCGLIATVVGFTAASVFTNEPMIPDGLATLLMVMIIASAGLLAGHERLRTTTVGVLLGALLLTKINVGGSVLLAVCFAVAASAPSLAGRPQARRAFIGLGLIMPFAVIFRDLGQGWAEDLAVLVAAGIATLECVQPRGRDSRPRHGPTVRWFVAGLAGAIVVLVVIILALGTTLHDLIHGVIIGPLGQRDAFSIAAPVGTFTADLAILGLLFALASRRLPAVPARPALAGVLRIAIGVLMLLWASSTFPITITPNPTTLGFALPFAWLVIRPPGAMAIDERQRFTRLLMAAVPVYGAISIYPVAGSQLGYAYTPFIPAAAVIVSDGALQIRHWLSHSKRPAFPALPHLAGAGLLIALAYQLLLQPAIAAGENYDALTPLPFAGVAHVRQPAATAAAFSDLVHVLRTRCTTFVSLPGMNSFYLWAHITPPTDLNATSWMYLFTSAQQQRVVTAVRGVHRLCLISNPAVLAGWEGPGPPPMRPLFTFVSSGFTPIYSNLGYTISIRKS